MLDDAKDAIQSLSIGGSSILTGSVDGHVRYYDLRKGSLTADYLGQPITSLVPAADAQTTLVATLDSRIRLLDMQSGAVLNTYEGHVHSQYRCRASFGHQEASVIFGDEEGRVWAWDLLDVSFWFLRIVDACADVGDTGKAIATQSASEGTREGDNMD